MATSIVQSWRALDPRRLWQVWNNVRLGWRLMRDRRVGWFPKLALLAAVAYVVLPFDFLPDVLPLIGQLDDVALLLLAWKFFLAFCPPEVVEEHARAIALEFAGR